jgi:flagellar protein FlgJ
MYEDMLYDEYAKDYTKNAGFGLADQVYLEVTGQRGRAVSRYA